MSFTVRISPAARADFRRLYMFLAEKDVAAARRGIDVIRQAFEVLKRFPYSCRKAVPDDPTLREMVIPFGNAGYVAAFRIRGNEVRILAIRHQFEDDYL